ncbi:MAG: hypothetical protein KAI02_06855 [Gammaproteobacteria bacterium]|nr:hypothetical protein [Gammaproteobacteria bacterium]
MTSSDKDQGMIAVILKRMCDQRLPRLIEIRDGLDDNKKLTNYDIEYLEEVFSDTQKNEHLAKNSGDKDLEVIFIKVVNLYKEITEKALANEGKD